MRQHRAFKQRHPDCLLLFRMGDFYEMFDEDAVAAHKALGLTLTQRTAGLPMAGVPFHQLDTYLRRLIAAGFRVAVADQMQDAAEAKGVIERAVTRVVTPGTLVDDTLLDADRASALAAVCFLESGDADGARVAVACVDLASGAFHVCECRAAEVSDELMRRSASEVLYAETGNAGAPPRVARVTEALAIAATPVPGWYFRADEARQALFDQFGVSTLAGFGFADDDPVVRAAGAVVRYLRATQSPRSASDGESGALGGALPHLRPPLRETPGEHVVLDAMTLRSLEVERTIRSGSVEGSLLGVFSGMGFGGGAGGGGAGRGGGVGCRTPMGRRLLRDWLCRPAARREVIESRQDRVAALVDDRVLARAVSGSLDGVQDVARIAGRVALGRATPRDLVALGKSLDAVRGLAAVLEQSEVFGATREAIAALAIELSPLSERIVSSCVDAPPSHLRDGGLIRDGVDGELDECRALQRDAAAWLSDYQARLLQEHQLPGMKVGYNKVFGYYIELTKAQARAAPAAFIRKQTLTNAERYITPELKQFEEKVTTAESRALAREGVLFDSLCAAAGDLLDPIARFADAASELDVLACFADKAHHRGWKRPELTDEPTLEVRAGRHPVLDESLGSRFVANDLFLASSGVPATLALITGPNMAGKSTFIRQTALLTLLAHTGSFLPADGARIGLTDRIFSRVGADDALHAGQSTFMVEMTETANILHHATERSLVVLDEIGRGTSTLDGLSLAWAVAEALASPPPRIPTPPASSPLPSGSSSPAARTPRTLFATHYHELTALQERPETAGRVINLHVVVREWPDASGRESIVFLHRIEPGRASQSYGVHVARLAGVPEHVIARAREVLESLSVQHAGPGAAAANPPPANHRAAPLEGQLSLFTEYIRHPAVDRLRELKLDALTPLQAFDALRQLKDLCKPDAQRG